ncbi:MAG: hypothetical protein AB7V44_16630 [Pseudonocardia sp.]
MDARSPEELETMLEDAVVLGDGRAAARLFASDGVLVARGVPGETRGRAELASVLPRLGYVADPRVVARCDDLALLLGPAAVNVARRGRRDRWRFAISVRAEPGPAE